MTDLYPNSPADFDLYPHRNDVIRDTRGVPVYPDAWSVVGYYAKRPEVRKQAIAELLECLEQARRNAYAR